MGENVFKTSLEAVSFIKSLSTNQIIKISIGELSIAWDSPSYIVVSSETDSPNVLFTGGENWLDSHVPDDERNSEAVREYIIDYVRSMYIYLIEDWDVD